MGAETEAEAEAELGDALGELEGGEAAVR